MLSTPNYIVTSHGNGWAYTITDKRTGESVFFQDHDADTLRDETHNFDDDYEHVIDSYFF